MILATRQHAVKSQPADSRTPGGEVLTSLIVPIIQLRGRFTKAGESIARAGGQTLARWLVMESVESSPKTVAQIARGMGLARQSVQRVADLLDGDRLVEYVENPDHQRSKLVRLTPRGHRALRTIQSTQRAWANKLAAEIGEADLRRASDVVNRLTLSLNSAARRNRPRVRGAPKET